MASLLAIPSVDREILARPPLKAMLGQVRFPSILRLSEPAGVAGLQELLRRDYPQFTGEQQFGITIDPTGVRAQNESRQWRLATNDSSWSVVVSPDFVTLEAAAPKYTSYDEFRDRFQQVWIAARESLEPAARLQQGLRYINHIERDSPAFDWSSVINPELLGFLEAPERRERLEHSLTDARFQLNDSILAMKHGVVRAGEHGQVGYLIDLDCFTQQHQEQLGVDEVLSTFDGFHNTIYSLFRWSVTEQAVEEFRSADR